SSQIVPANSNSERSMTDSIADLYWRGNLAQGVTIRGRPCFFLRKNYPLRLLKLRTAPTSVFAGDCSAQRAARKSGQTGNRLPCSWSKFPVLARKFPVLSQKFPVLLSREFLCKALNLLACQRAKSLPAGEFNEIPC